MLLLLLLLLLLLHSSWPSAVMDLDICLHSVCWCDGCRMAKGQADLAPTSSSWEITAAHTSSDCMQSTGSSNVSSGRAVKETLNAVQLGTLLGAGSFGRVYKGGSLIPAAMTSLVVPLSGHQHCCWRLQQAVIVSLVAPVHTADCLTCSCVSCSVLAKWLAVPKSWMVPLFPAWLSESAAAHSNTSHAASLSAGRWMGRVVAVKVLHHSIKSAELVLNEVNLMLSFKHPNVVRAYHVINWAHRRRPTEPEPLPSTSEDTTSGATATMPSVGVPFGAC
jgi:serine/threonine protein kinase